MSDIVKLLREAAMECRNNRPLEIELSEAADELEASAEWALCRWLAEDARRGVHLIPPSRSTANLGYCCIHEVNSSGSRFYDITEYGAERAGAIRAAIKAWEER